jgi:hypothetical protein
MHEAHKKICALMMMMLMWVNTDERKEMRSDEEDAHVGKRSDDDDAHVGKHRRAATMGLGVLETI